MGREADATYIVAARLPFTVVHIQRSPASTACGQRMQPADLWVRSTYDPDRDGTHLLCAACGGTAASLPEPERTNEQHEEELTLL